MAPKPISNKKSVLALVEEVNEAVPVVPSSADQYTTLQEGFTFTPSFNTLQNTELRGSIAKAKDEISDENPTMSFSHYVKASGVAGKAPDYGLLFKACLGSVKIDSAERDTVAGSTTKVINVDAGEGVNYERGQALLVQKPSGFEIRNILSVSTDALTLAQVLKDAPASGVLLGRAILYKAIDEGHPTITPWLYRGNGGAIEAMAGGRVTSMQIACQANQYINASFTIDGVKYYFNPIIITSSSRFLDFLDDATTRSISIEAKVYRDPHDLADAINQAILALGSSNEIKAAYNDSTGKFSITSDGTTLSLLWNSGANAANSIGAKLGFSVAADDTGALSYISDNEQNWASPFSPDYDDTNANVAKNLEVIMGGENDVSCFGAQSVNISVSNTKTDIPDLCEESGKSGSLFTAREVTIQVTALLEKNDADNFRRFREGDKTLFALNFGIKRGGQWLKNNCCNVFSPSTTITAFEITDQDGLAILNTTLTAYTEDSLAEIYANFI